MDSSDEEDGSSYTSHSHESKFVHASQSHESKYIGDNINSEKFSNGFTQLRKRFENKKYDSNPNKLDKDFGSFEKHTKGIGLKLLKKMGFKGKLGKDENGISRPVEVQLRPKNLGLAAGGFQENALPDFRKENEEKEEKVFERPIEIDNWKKNNIKRQKIYYKTASDLEKEKTSDDKSDSTVIYDMRGPTTKVISSDNISTLSYNKNILFPELVHNLNLIVEITELDIEKAVRTKKNYEDSINKNEEEIKDIQTSILKNQQEIEILQSKIEKENINIQNIQNILKILNDWDVKSPESVLKIIEDISLRIDKDHFQQLLTQNILPKLQKEVENWDPNDYIPIDSWIFPWLTLLYDDLYPIFNIIISKISVKLKNWTASDESAFNIIYKWKNVWKTRDINIILYKYIIPKLKSEMKSFTINIRNQNVNQIQYLLKWMDIIEIDNILDILEQEFFPKWIHALYNWLINNPNFEEVSNWYKLWKNFFPKTISNHYRFEKQLKNALELMNAAVTDENIDKIMSKTIKSLRISSKPPDTSKNKKNIIKEDSNISFKDVVEKFAIMKSIPFTLTNRHSSDGLQIFSFGKFNIKLDNRCIFALLYSESLKKKEWRPIGLDELVGLCEKENL